MLCDFTDEVRGLHLLTNPKILIDPNKHSTCIINHCCLIFTVYPIVFIKILVTFEHECRDIVVSTAMK